MESGIRVKEQTRRFAERQKEAGADTVSSVAGAIRGAAHELEDKMPNAAGLVEDAAGQLEWAASQLQERSVDDLLSGVGRFARERPLIFFGGAVLAGFAIARFLKSSGSSPAA